MYVYIYITENDKEFSRPCVVMVMWLSGKFPELAFAN